MDSSDLNTSKPSFNLEDDAIEKIQNLENVIEDYESAIVEALDWGDECVEALEEAESEIKDLEEKVSDLENEIAELKLGEE